MAGIAVAEFVEEIATKTSCYSLGTMLSFHKGLIANLEVIRKPLIKEVKCNSRVYKMPFIIIS